MKKIKILILLILLISFTFCLAVISASAETKNVYLENHFWPSIRVRKNTTTNMYETQQHSGDSCSYVLVSGSEVYYADGYDTYYYGAGEPTKGSVVLPVSFPFEVPSDGYLVINDAVDGTMTDLKVYFVETIQEPDPEEPDPGPDEPGPDDPDNPNPEDPDNPNPEDPGTDPSPNQPSVNVDLADTNALIEKLDKDVNDNLYEVRLLSALLLAVLIISIFIKRSQDVN